MLLASKIEPGTNAAPPRAVPIAALADELADRWARARLSALRRFAPEATGDEPSHVAAVPAERWSDAEDQGFDNSLRLGDSFRRYHRLGLGLEELGELLPLLGVPCLSGCARAVDGALELEREPCGADARRCDQLRECALGMVLGLSDGAVRHARHRSRGHGDPRCLDVLYTDPESAHRYGPIPDEIAGELAAIRASIARLGNGASVEFLGVSEGQLAYRTHGPRGALAIGAMLEGMVRRRLPSLTPVDTAPRAVLSDSASQGE